MQISKEAMTIEGRLLGEPEVVFSEDRVARTQVSSLEACDCDVSALILRSISKGESGILSDSSYTHPPRPIRDGGWST